MFFCISRRSLSPSQDNPFPVELLTPTLSTCSPTPSLGEGFPACRASLSPTPPSSSECPVTQQSSMIATFMLLQYRAGGVMAPHSFSHSGAQDQAPSPPPSSPWPRPCPMLALIPRFFHGQVRIPRQLWHHCQVLLLPSKSCLFTSHAAPSAAVISPFTVRHLASSIAIIHIGQMTFPCPFHMTFRLVTVGIKNLNFRRRDGTMSPVHEKVH